MTLRPNLVTTVRRMVERVNKIHTMNDVSAEGLGSGCCSKEPVFLQRSSGFAKGMAPEPSCQVSYRGRSRIEIVFGTPLSLATTKAQVVFFASALVATVIASLRPTNLAPKERRNCRNFL